jgi:hypothetical protein
MPSKQISSFRNILKIRNCVKIKILFSNLFIFCIFLLQNAKDFETNLNSGYIEFELKVFSTMLKINIVMFCSNKNVTIIYFNFIYLIYENDRKRIF